jgi:Ca2+-binding EF-hand superfamily protein
VNLKGRHNFF